MAPLENPRGYSGPRVALLLTILLSILFSSSQVCAAPGDTVIIELPADSEDAEEIDSFTPVNLSGNWVTRDSKHALRIEHSGVDITLVYEEISLQGQFDDNDSFRVHRLYRRPEDVPLAVRDQSERLIQLADEFNIWGKASESLEHISASFIFTKSGEVERRRLYRTPEIAAVSVVPTPSQWLPALPGHESRILFVVGRNLYFDNDKSLFPNVAEGMVYYPLAFSSTDIPYPSQYILRNLGDLPQGVSWQESDVGREIIAYWKAAWSQQLPAIPIGPGTTPNQFVLYRADAISQLSTEGTQRFSLRTETKDWELENLADAQPTYCPEYIDQLSRKDQTPEVAGQTQQIRRPVSMVAALAANPRESTATRLEQHLRLHPDVLGQGLVEKNVSHACDHPTQPRSESLNVAMTTNYYSGKRRLASGVLASLQSLASLEAFTSMDCKNSIGSSSVDNRLGGLTCSSFDTVIGGASACQTLKQCPNAADFGPLVDQTEIALRTLREIEVLVESTDDSEAQNRLASLQSLVRGANPWLAGEAFQGMTEDIAARCLVDASDYSECTREVRRRTCEGIRAEASELKALVSEHLDRFLAAAECLDAECDLDPQEYRATLAQAPRLEISDPMDPGEAAIRTNWIKHQFDLALQRAEFRDIQDDVDKAYRDFYVGTALTIATVGIGSVANSLRVASTGTKAVEAAATTARGLELIVLGIDAGQIGLGIKNRISECANAFNQTGALEGAYSSRMHCPGDTGYDGPRAISDYQSCVLTAVSTELATGLLPAVPAGVSAAMRRSLLRRAAGVLDGHKLTSAEMDLVAEVFAKRFLRQSKYGLEESMRKLQTGFSREQSLALIDALSPHIRRLDDKLVRGLKGRSLGSARTTIGETPHTLSIQQIGNRVELAFCTFCLSYTELLDNTLKLKGLSRAKRRELRALKEKVESLRQLVARNPASITEHADQLDELAELVGRHADLQLANPNQVITGLARHDIPDDVVHDLLNETTLEGGADGLWIVRMLDKGKIDAGFVQRFTSHQAGPRWDALQSVIEDTTLPRKFRNQFVGKMVGILGEEAAEKVIREAGHELLAREFKYGTGSIDVITRKDGIIRFSEVKNWSTDSLASGKSKLIRQLTGHNDGVKAYLRSWSMPPTRPVDKVLMIAERGWNQLTDAMKESYVSDLAELGWSIELIPTATIESFDAFIDRMRDIS